MLVVGQFHNGAVTTTAMKSFDTQQMFKLMCND